MNFCTSCGPLGEERTALLLFPFIKALDLKEKMKERLKKKKMVLCDHKQSGFGKNSFRSH